ncbi:hypothetical protein [Streptomyces canus]|uniref:hypothetical protein n=1 Tax=Streptomyces canus TaxID=58343 RepID=UPI00224FC18C|nr:hypothetical protein [Streptomyces canus]MCX4856638.1 hypothetical protein [Streptomyces canus]
MLLIEYSSREAELPPEAEIIDLQQNVGLRLAHLHVSYCGKRVGVWLIERTGPSPDKDALHRLRVHLLRLHAEYEWVRLVLRGLTRNAGGVRSVEAVRYFLDRGIDLLSSPQKYGFDQDPILAAAYGAERIATSDEWVTVLGMLTEKRIYELLRIQQKTAASGGSVTYIANRILIVEGDGTVSEYNTSAGHDLNAVIGQDNIVTESFNKIENSKVDDESKALLKQLAQTIALTVGKLPEGEATRVKDDFTAFQDEALSTKPRRKILEAFGDSLQKAASFVGDVGAPVAKLVTAVIGLVA